MHVSDSAKEEVSNGETVKGLKVTQLAVCCGCDLISRSFAFAGGKASVGKSEASYVWLTSKNEKRKDQARGL